MNERDWNPETGLPTTWDSKSEMNVAEYCRLYIQDEWKRLSPSTRKSYIEALTSFTINCTRRGVPRLPALGRIAIGSWLTPTLTTANSSLPSIWVWSDEPLPRSVQIWVVRRSPSLGDLDRELLYDDECGYALTGQRFTPPPLRPDWSLSQRPRYQLPLEEA